MPLTAVNREYFSPKPDFLLYVKLETEVAKAFEVKSYCTTHQQRSTSSF